MTDNLADRVSKIEGVLGLKKGETTIHLILDMSGSMSAIGQTEVLGSANKYIKEVKESIPDASIEVIVFDTDYEQVIKPTKVASVRKLTPNDYAPRGATALYDAIGRTAAAAKTGRNLFVVLTDGQENSSHEFTSETLKSLIKKSEQSGNQFIYLGANQNVVLEARKIGILPQMTYSYLGTAAGYRGATAAATSATQDWAAGDVVDLGNTSGTASPA